MNCERNIIVNLDGKVDKYDPIILLKHVVELDGFKTRHYHTMDI